jgi:CRP/FNR family transcriptional regulator, cyclic AMP receptor protein
MLERFQGKDGRAVLLEALRRQFLVDGNSEIADKIASAAVIKEYKPSAPLFNQGARSSDLCFILSGRVSIKVDGSEVSTCGAGIHVGEISMLEPFKGRSATVDAMETVVTAEISEHKFTSIPIREEATRGKTTAFDEGRQTVRP